MRSRKSRLSITFVAAASAFAAIGAFAGSSNEQLQRDLDDDQIVGDWHYDDIPAGISDAKKSGRPLMIVFR